MPTKTHKLRNVADFASVRKLGRYTEQGSFRLTCLAYAGRLEGRTRRFGVVASRKLVGDAVRRNRAKRVFRVLLRTHAEKLPPLCDVAVIIRASYENASFARLSEKFAKACVQLTHHFEKSPPPLQEAELKKPASASHA